MFDFFKRSKIAPQQNIDPVKKQETMDYGELNNQFDSIRDEIDQAVRKQFDYTQFELSRDDQSNYFGLEFDIQTTAARLKGMYVREPWVFTAADRIARNASTVPMKIIDVNTGDPMPNHPANGIINNGLAFQDEITRQWVEYLDLILTGNSFGILDESSSNLMVIPTELITLESKGNASFDEIMKYGAIESANIYGYGVNAISLSIPSERIIQCKLPNPYNPFYGLSPFAAASRPLLLDRYKNEFEMAFYHRGASHSGVIENEQELGKDKMRRLISSFEAMYTGKRNWWRPMFLPKGAKWKASTLTMAEMQHLEGLRENRLTILAILGIPPSQVGIVQDVNRSTSEQQTKIFWQNTIMPLVTFKCAGYNNSYLFKYQFGGQVKVVPDFSGIQAIEGSLASKGETAKLVENYLKVNEIRTMVLGVEPLPPNDPRGDLFAKEIMPNPMASYEIAPVPPIDQTPNDENQNNQINEADTYVASEKNIAKSSMTMIEKSLVAKFLVYLRSYEQMIWEQTLYAIDNGRNVKVFLMVKEGDRRQDFINTGIPILIDAMNRGYSMSMLATKRITSAKVKAKVGYEFTPEDEQAIDAIRERTADRRRKILVAREIESFDGWDKNYSEYIMQVIEDGMKEGKTLQEIAIEIRQSMDKRGGQTYRDQCFTIARTETLCSVSEGIKWSTDTLKAVFTEVNKIWLHRGDYPQNPDARKTHVDFEALGERPADYIYKDPETEGEMSYPRDPSGQAEDVINCRCAMANSIPKTAYSRAKSIL